MIDQRWQQGQYASLQTVESRNARKDMDICDDWHRPGLASLVNLRPRHVGFLPQLRPMLHDMEHGARMATDNADIGRTGYHRDPWQRQSGNSRSGIMEIAMAGLRSSTRFWALTQTPLGRSTALCCPRRSYPFRGGLAAPNLRPCIFPMFLYGGGHAPPSFVFRLSADGLP